MVMQKANHYTAFIFWRVVNGVVEVLMVYNRTLAQLKFPGGSAKDPDKTPRDTGYRECLEEVFKKGRANRELLENAKIETSTIIRAGFHTKHFMFLEWNPDFGEMRDFVMMEKDERKFDERGRPTQTESIDPPRFIELKEALVNSFPPHKAALKASVLKMCDEPRINTYVARCWELL